MTTRLADELSKRGHSVAIVTKMSPDTDFYEVAPGVARRAIHDTRVSGGVGRALAALSRHRAIRRAILAENPDVVISFMSKWNIRVAASLLGCDVPLIVSERVDPSSEPLSFPWNLLRRCFYRRVSRLVSVSRAMDAKFAWVRSERREVLYNPIVGRAPAFPDWDDRSHHVIAMGRLVPQKGFDILINAIAPVLTAHQDWSLYILGEGPERDRLQSMVDRHRLEGQIKLVGNARDPERWLRNARIFVLSSRYEGYPNALIEALGQGVASVASDCATGPAEILTHDETGLLVPVSDEDGLRQAVEYLIEHPAESRRIAEAGYAKSDDFNIESLVDRWETVLSSVT